MSLRFRPNTRFLDASPLSAMTGTSDAAPLSAEQVGAILEDVSPRAVTNAAVSGRSLLRLLRVLVPAMVVIVWLAASLAAPA
jgi:hypothetical protein